MCYELPTEAHRKSFKWTKERLNGKLGLLCFSRDWQNPVLWSHYAAKHRGICLGFDADDVLTVTYSANRPHFTGDPANITDDFTHKWLSTKFIGWQYEEEERAFVKLDEAEEETGLYYRKFGPHLQLKQVIVGPLGTVTSSLQKAIGSLAGEIEILKARLAFRSFRVTRDKHRFWDARNIRRPRLI
jgi:hypothetical protein